jgi:hypothetical protein
MAFFRYKKTWLEWEAQKGYRDPVTTEWVGTPQAAVAGCMQRYPEQEDEWAELARMIGAFWASVPCESVGEIEEVRFDG